MDVATSCNGKQVLLQPLGAGADAEDDPALPSDSSFLSADAPAGCDREGRAEPPAHDQAAQAEGSASASRASSKDAPPSGATAALGGSPPRARGTSKDSVLTAASQPAAASQGSPPEGRGGSPRASEGEGEGSGEAFERHCSAAASQRSAALLGYLRTLLLDATELTGWYPASDPQKLGKA